MNYKKISFENYNTYTNSLKLIEYIKEKKPLNEILSLIKSGIDVNVQDEHGRTPLLFTIVYDDENGEDIIRALTAEGADKHPNRKRMD